MVTFKYSQLSCYMCIIDRAIAIKEENPDMDHEIHTQKYQCLHMLFNVKYVQEYKYLSEPYSEDLDQEAARRLLEFGDDYRKYIDSDGASSFSGFNAPSPLHHSHFRGRRSPHHRRPRCLAPQGPRDLDSDSDLDDLHHVIDQSNSQLAVTENTFKKRSNDSAPGLDFVSIYIILYFSSLLIL